MKRFKFLIIMAMLALLFPAISIGGAAWDDRNIPVLYQRASGNGATYTGLTAADVVTDGAGSVGISCAGHDFYTGSQVVITGSTSYDNTHTITAVSANSFTITYPYTAETMTNSYSVSVSLKPLTGDGFQLLGFSLRLDTAASTADSFSVTVDSAATSYSGATFDRDIWSTAGTNTTNGSMSGVKDIVKSYDTSDGYRYVPGDEIDFKWANTDSREWAIEILYRKRN